MTPGNYCFIAHMRFPLVGAKTPTGEEPLCGAATGDKEEITFVSFLKVEEGCTRYTVIKQIIEMTAGELEDKLGIESSEDTWLGNPEILFLSIEPN